MGLRKSGRGVFVFFVFTLLMFSGHVLATRPEARAYDQKEVRKVVSERCRDALKRASEKLVQLSKKCKLDPLGRLLKPIGEDLFLTVLSDNMLGLLVDVVAHAVERCHIIDRGNRDADDGALIKRVSGTLVKPDSLEQIKKAGTVSGVLVGDGRKKLKLHERCSRFLDLVAQATGMVLDEVTLAGQKQNVLNVSFSLVIPGVLCDVFRKGESKVRPDLSLSRMLFFVRFDLNSFFDEEEDEKEPEGGSMFPEVEEE